MVARPNNDYELSDIYDGRIWKEFKDPNEDRLFFRHDVSDSNLGIMLNLDWFQPFDNSQYSVRVIYGVICNLPRSERFKTSNTITLAVIPGSGEPKLHKLNHYLALIIDQFIELWKGIDISTNKLQLYAVHVTFQQLENSVGSYRLVPLVIYVKR